MTIQEQIIAKIEEYDTIIIHRHQRPDPDAFGSQSGLATIIRNSYPDKKVYIVGKTVPGLAWIAEMDTIEDSIYDNALVIVTDTANAPRIDDQRYPTGKEMIKIDHHPNDEPYGDLQWVVADASSTSSLIYELAEQSHGKMTLNAEAARVLYAGIVGDTGRFLYSVDSETMRVVSQLFKFDFDIIKVNQKMDAISPEAAKLSGYVLQNLNIVEDGLAYMVLSNELVSSFDLGESGTAFVVPLPGRVDSVRTWVVFEEQDDHSYRVRLRSKDMVINTIARNHAGGGHPLASGARARDMDEVNDIIDELARARKRYNDRLI
ncbi:bifunctional oligoribonuclease/PAP phosphatase NrnA [Periweissella fabaria]|uniref:Bifunctional oligoribonuclease and PAP phosphatase NrnA n=1 Tax=Periweissella fabaria TaxID=546157 RepID=A0ABM8Z7D1_9LACO|nr:bifunctional oligoribonuclease/PAP phosphatase NrnA [Periweissella fabaria]MCM0597790.1 bifunctional oligoribonuclease/PAP phosphatase NrnA [Periweissella fabaria]CAH0417239.1 putative bifunctional oligoribonuclease and PAP phosphatase NrnA [Periweissella fabaria]